ncbi:contractile injection system tape measure protein [Kordia sp.]|uniref:contractile injection system tape measure protein n=1 Tax=Kordia sp. TaxID=1965332 RepID=UPI003D2E7630
MHTVHNILFEVAVNHEEQDISWEQYYVNFFQDRLLPKVEKLCNTWDEKHPNKKCSIDEIDINVEIDHINLDELQEKIITKINDQLHSLNEHGTTKNGSVRATITSVASPFDALVLYLKNGILPAHISVKNFKEWLGTIVQFTASEKTTLTALFSSNSETIERMVSLLRNDFEKFAAILETNQKITKQYIKLEENFFKKFVQAICGKSQLIYQEAQANIWFKTLGLSSSLAQFSKTFIQLFTPKALAEQKRLVNVNEHNLSVAILQTIIQYDLQKPLNIAINNIFEIRTITKDVQNEVDKSTNTQQKTTTKTGEDAAKQNITKDTVQNKTQAIDAVIEVSSQQKSEQTTTENHQNKLQEEDEVTKLTDQNNIETQTSKENDQTKTSTKNTTNQAAVIDQETSNTNQSERKKVQENTVETTTDTNSQEKQESHPATAQQNVPKTNQESTIEVDNRIFEKLSKLNSPVREIPLTTEKAGLILLNPFLVRFFTGAKLVNADNKITAVGKAAMLLHFLATGTEEATDVELTLEKIFLGIPLDTIINYQTPLTDEDKALCNELLQAVIQHWSVLKNSSENTLRDMFIKREGQITFKKDSITLVVERLAQDILLDKVPWSIGLFQLKWMDKRMHIEW